MSSSGTGPERRRLQRYGLAIPAIVHTASGTEHGDIPAISKRGLFVRTLANPSEGEQVRVSFQVPMACRLPREGDPSRIEVTGRVEWTSDTQNGAPTSQPGFRLRIDEWNQDFQELFERMLFLEPERDAD